MQKIILLFFIIISFLSAQMSEQVLKKQVVYFEKLAYFIKWPKEKSNIDPLIIGIIGENPYEDYLDIAYANRDDNKRKVIIKEIVTLDEISECHMLYIGELNYFTLEEIIDASYGVFLISHSDGLGEKGVHLNYYIQGDKLKFEINPYSSMKNSIRINAKLIKLAKIVGSE